MRRTLRATLDVCVGAAAGALALVGLTVSWRAGAALAAGLLIGSSNGFLANRSLHAGGFRMFSMARLALLSGAGVLVGLALGADVLWLVALGLALAQVALTAVAAREVLSQR